MTGDEFDFSKFNQPSTDWQSDQEQEDVLASIAEWWAQGLSQCVTVGGYAGTGKTHVIARIAERLGLPPDLIAFCAPTGKAASVLESRLRQEGVHAEVRTIHSLLYVPAERHLCGCGQCTESKQTGDLVPVGKCPRPLRNIRGHVLVQVTYALRGKLPEASLVIADEASMIGRTEWENLRELGTRIIAVGDHGQLRPVKSDFSLMASPDLRLEIVRRQAAGDPITVMATLARTTGRIPHGIYGPLARKITPDQATAGLLAGHARWQPGTLMIGARKATVAQLNRWVRPSCVPADKFGALPVLVSGDQVICLRNSTGARNGQVLRVAEIVSEDGDRIRFRTDGGLELTAATAQFGEEDLLAPSEIPRGAGLFGYGYAVTCHKAQGSEAGRVIVVEEDWPRRPDDRARWLYTACTRARAELTVIGL